MPRLTVVETEDVVVSVRYGVKHDNTDNGENIHVIATTVRDELEDLAELKWVLAVVDLTNIDYLRLCTTGRYMAHSQEAIQ